MLVEKFHGGVAIYKGYFHLWKMALKAGLHLKDRPVMNIKRAQKDGEQEQLEEENAATQEAQAEEESSDDELDEDGFEMVAP